MSSRSRRASAGRLGQHRVGTVEFPDLRVNNLLGGGADNCAAAAPSFFEADVDARVCSDGADTCNSDCDAPASKQTFARESLPDATEGFRGVAVTMTKPVGSLECDTCSSALMEVK